MTLYEELIAENIEVSNHYSDLYFPVNDKTSEIIKKRSGLNVRTFINNITNTLWYDVSFAYDPFWTNKEKNVDNNANSF
jgi:hypothetical protein